MLIFTAEAADGGVMEKQPDALRVYPDLHNLLPHELDAMLKANVWPDLEKRKYAQYLLERKEQEQTDIARRAADAAWISANAARKANNLMIITVIISVIALAFSIAAFFSSGPSSP